MRETSTSTAPTDLGRQSPNPPLNAASPWWGLAGAAATGVWAMSSLIDSPDGRRVVINLLQLSAALSAAAIAGWRARRVSGPARRHLVMLGLAATSWAAGQLYWTVSETLLARILPFPSLADFGFATSYPMLVAALVLAPASRHVMSRLRHTLDGLVVAGSILFVSWAGVLDTVFAGLDVSTLPGQLGLAYPLADVLLVTVAASTVVRTRGLWLRPLTFMCAGLVGIAIADTGFAYLESTGRYSTGSLVDLGWVLGWLLVATGASVVPVHVMPAGPATIDRPGRLASIVPIAAMSIVLVAATILHLAGGSFAEDPVLLCIGLGLFVLNVARAVVASAEGDAHAQQLTEVLNRHAVAFDAAAMGTFAIDFASRTVRRSPELNALLGLGTGPTTVSTDQAVDSVDPRDSQFARHIIESAIATDGDFEFEVRSVREDGSLMWLRAQGRGVTGADGTMVAIVGAITDVTDRVAADGRIQQQALQSMALAELAQRALTAPDLATTLDDAVGTVAGILGAPLCKVLQIEPDHASLRLVAGHGWQAGLVGEATVGTDRDSHAGYTLTASEPVIVDDLLSETRFSGTALLHDHGVRSGMSTAINTVGGAWGLLGVHTTEPRHFTPEDANFLRTVASTIGAAVDRAAHEEQRQHLNLHDPLTDLPNRALLHDRLTIGIATARQTSRYVAVIHIGIDRFNVVNTSLGIAAGDQALIEIGRRLQALSGPADTVARLDGDEFMLAATVDNAHAAVDLATRVLAVIAEPLVLGEPPQELFLSASVGVAVANGGGGDTASHLRDASIAADRASASGGRRYEVFDDRFRERAVRRLQVEAELRYAIADGQIEPHYQPIVHVGTGALVGVEALARWQHPTRGLLEPSEFLDAADAAGLASALGEVILLQSARDAARWNELSGASLHVSVNVSSSQLTGTLLDVVDATLAATGLPPDRLCLEIIESALADNSTDALNVLDQLIARWPISVHIDDFGTGHSSLSRLSMFPVTGIKIDRAFVSDLGQTPTARPVVAAIIDLGHALDLEVTAEGVETGDQLDELRDLGCDLAQGWLFARAMPAAEIDRLLADPTTMHQDGSATWSIPAAAAR